MITRLLALLLPLTACEPATLPIPTACAAPESSAAAPQTVTPLTAGGLLEDELNTISVFEMASKSTVFITNSRLVNDYSQRRTVEVPRGSGTGFVWDKRGHIVTNAHVVHSSDGKARYTVTLSDGRTFKAELRSTDPYKDLAVLRLVSPPSDLVPIRLPPKGSSPRVGQKVIAIGNPFGLDNTLTTGVVSALGRDVEGFGQVTIRDMIQTDASINPGNSGGPLLDSSGQLIGVNTMIFSSSGSSAGIGFAVPVEAVRRGVPYMINTGKPLRVGLGVRLADPNRLRAARIQVPGVAVQSVDPDTPAAKAGLRGFTSGPNGTELGDVIVAVDGKPVRNFDDLYIALDGHAPGDVVTLTVLRGETQTDLRVKLIQLQ